MANNRHRVLRYIRKYPGSTDHEITDHVLGPGKRQQSINQICRQLEGAGLVVRRKRSDGLIGNYPVDTAKRPSSFEESDEVKPNDPLSEDTLKNVLGSWLTSQGWTTMIAMGKKPSIDIDAKRGSE